MIVQVMVQMIVLIGVIDGFRTSTLLQGKDDQYVWAAMTMTTMKTCHFHRAKLTARLASEISGQTQVLKNTGDFSTWDKMVYCE